MQALLDRTKKALVALSIGLNYYETLIPIVSAEPWIATDLTAQNKTVLDFCEKQPENRENQFVLREVRYLSCCDYHEQTGYEFTFSCDKRGRAHGVNEDGGISKWQVIRVHDKWVMPYYYDTSVTNPSRPDLYAAVTSESDIFNMQTCIKPVQKVGQYNSESYDIKIQNDGSGCNAPVGTRGANANYPMNLGNGCEGAFTHELLHCLGIFHEHQRPDRGTGSRYDWRTFQDPSWLGTYAKQGTTPETMQNEGFLFDAASTMHYYTEEWNQASYSYELRISDRSGWPFITSDRAGSWYDDWASEIGTATYAGNLMSRIDALHLNRMYSCYDLVIPKGVMLRFRSKVNSNQFFTARLNDDDTITAYGGNLAALKNALGHSPVIQFIFLDPTNGGYFNIREETPNTAASRTCYSYTGGTTACNSGAGLNDDSYLFSFSPEGQWVVLYDPANPIDLSSTSVVESNKVQLSSGYNYQKGQFINADGISALIYNDLCMIQNGYCSDYCRTNSDKTRECYCAEGWELSSTDNTVCVEINECEQANSCGGSIETSSAQCYNLYGTDFAEEGHRCKCDWGYSFDDNNRCVSDAAASLDSSYFKFILANDPSKCLGQKVGSDDFEMVTCSTADANGWDIIWEHTDAGEIKSLQDQKCLGAPYQCDSGNWYMSTYACQDGAELDQVFELEPNGAGIKIKVSGCGGLDKCMGLYGTRGLWWGCSSGAIFTQETVEDVSAFAQTPVSDETLSSSLSKTVTEIDISGLNFCRDDWQRIHQSKNRDEIYCVDHKQGNFKTLNFKTGDVSTSNNDACKYSPMDTLVLSSQDWSFKLMCIQKENPNDGWAAWCPVGDNSWGVTAKMVVGDYSGDNVDDIACVQTDGTVKVAKYDAASNNFPSVTVSSGLPIGRGEHFDIWAFDDNNDGSVDIIGYFASLGTYQVLHQEAEQITEITTSNGLMVCPSMDEATDTNDADYCSWYVSAGYCTSNVTPCRRSCGMCKGSAVCGNNYDNNYSTNCDYPKVNNAWCQYQQYKDNCPLTCSGCTPEYASTPGPYWGSTLAEDDTVTERWSNEAFCKGLYRYSFFQKMANNDIEHYCFDYGTGTLSDTKTGDKFTDFCKSNYIRNSQTQNGKTIPELEMPDQRTAVLMIIHDSETNQDEYMCIERATGKVWYTGSFTDNVPNVDHCAIKGCSDTCSVSNNQAVCSCQTGWTLDADGINCTEDEASESSSVEVDPCLNSSCEVCTNVNGSAVCSCSATSDVLAADGTSCVDACLGNSCEHNCDSSTGSAVCSCNAGYSPDGDDCISECVNKGCEHDCNIVSGAPICSCPSGQVVAGDGTSCETAGDDCSSLTCSHGCYLADGVPLCACPIGFSLSLDDSTCVS